MSFPQGSATWGNGGQLARIKLFYQRDFPGEMLRTIETWSSAQPQEVSRSEAIRRLVGLGLKAKPKA